MGEDLIFCLVIHGLRFCILVSCWIQLEQTPARFQSVSWIAMSNYYNFKVLTVEISVDISEY